MSPSGVWPRHLTNRIESETFGLGCPDFVDVFVGREAFECLRTPVEIDGDYKVFEMCLELLVIVVV